MNLLRNPWAYHAREGSSTEAEEHHNAQSDAQTQRVRAEADDRWTHQKTDIAAQGDGPNVEKKSYLPLRRIEARCLA